MPQSNTSQQAAKLPSADIGNVTSETLFKDSGGTAVLQLPLPCSSKFLNRPMQVLVGGRAQGGTTTNFTGKLYFGNSATIGSNTALASTGAVALASAKHNWMLVAFLQFDNDSQKVQGWFEGQIANTAIANTAQSNVITGVDMTAGDTDISATAAGGNKVLTVTGLFSSGNAGNHAYVDFFEVQNF